MTNLPATLLASLLGLAATEPPTTTGDTSVMIFRCVSSNGEVALRDSPCPQGRQQVLQRIRPQDPPPTPAATVAPLPAAPAPPAAPRVVVVNSQPLFECTTAEGERYTADDGEGNPRWVPGPLVPVILAPPHPRSRPPMHRGPGMHTGQGQRPSTALPVAGTFLAGGGQWVRDSCQRLTRQEACSVLSEQRWELIGRYNSALQGEREQLVREQRRVEERMAQQPCNR